MCSPLRHKFGQCWLAIDETVVLQEKYTSFFLFFLLSLFQFLYFFRSLCVHMYLQRITYPSCHVLRSCTACYHQIGQVITSVCVRLSALCFNTRLVSESSLNLSSYNTYISSQDCFLRTAFQVRRSKDGFQYNASRRLDPNPRWYAPGFKRCLQCLSIETNTSM